MDTDFLCIARDDDANVAYQFSMYFDPHKSDGRQGDGINNGDTSDDDERQNATSELERGRIEILDCDPWTLPR